MPSKYVDQPSIVQVITCVFKAPQLLDFTDKYTLTSEDFEEDFHKVVFGSIYNIHATGAKKITLENINDYLSSRPKYLAIYTAHKGNEWILNNLDSANIMAFDYYYQRVKKFSLLRAYSKFGMDVSWIYDVDNILNLEKKQRQSEALDAMSLEDIAKKIDDKIDEIKYRYVSNTDEEASQAGEGALELIQSLKKYPEVGVPLYGPLINTITRGARLKKLYLRSAATGIGKTRSMIADACNIGCEWIYDDSMGWIRNGTKQPTLYITTEQEIGEIQTMMLAFLANVNEEHILNNSYEFDEEERVVRAAEILADSPLYIKELHDFSLQDVEDEIKKGIRDYDIKYIAYDYIHTSMKILEEITRRSGGVRLREDNILFMLSNKLKDICNQYEVFIITSTQLNGDWKDAEIPDQNLLRGAKSIADKI